MGWSNFIVIPDWKLLIEVSRDLQTYNKDFTEESFDGLFESVDNFNFECLETKLTEVDLKTVSGMVAIVDNCSFLQEFNYNEFLLVWLNNRKIDYKILSSFDIDNDEEKYKDYKKISR